VENTWWDIIWVKIIGIIIDEDHTECNLFWPDRQNHRKLFPKEEHTNERRILNKVYGGGEV
jgi:hypothetical protein